MDITQLKYFKVLAEKENMSKAANELHIAQSALSRTLSNLEKELDVTLFDRVGKFIHLNDSGRILLKYVNNILAEIEYAKVELNELKNSANQTLNILVHAGNTSMPEIVYEFTKIHPNITLNIIQKPIKEEVDIDIDIAIYPSMTPTKDKHGVVLFEEEVRLVVPLSHPFCKLDKVSLIDIKDQSIIMPSKTIGFREVVDSYCRSEGFEPKVAIEIDSPNMAYDMVVKGLGVSLIPRVSWESMESGSNIKLIDVEKPKCLYYINMVWNEKRFSSKASSLMREYLMNYFGDKYKNHYAKSKND